MGREYFHFPSIHFSSSNNAKANQSKNAPAGWGYSLTEMFATQASPLTQFRPSNRETRSARELSTSKVSISEGNPRHSLPLTSLAPWQIGDSLILICNFARKKKDESEKLTWILSRTCRTLPLWMCLRFSCSFSFSMARSHMKRFSWVCLKTQYCGLRVKFEI